MSDIDSLKGAPSNCEEDKAQDLLEKGKTLKKVALKDILSKGNYEI